MPQKRFDVTALTLGKNVKETPQGFLVIPAYTARTGIQSYKMKDGSTLKEYRPDEEVFSESSMSSLRTAAVTDGHPKDMVSPQNAHELMLGHADGVVEKVTEADESFLKTHLIITHQRAIDAIKAGKAELSNGYNVNLDFTPGEYKGQRYDAIQRDIVNNHVAIVWNGRAGKKVRLKLDSNEALLDNNNAEIETMKIKLGEKEFDVNDELGAAFNEFMAKAPKADEVETLKKENTELKGDKTKLTAKADSLQSELDKKPAPKLDQKELDAAVKERMAIMDSGKKMLDKETLAKLEGMTNDEIKKAVIKVDSPKVEESKLADAVYVQARYDHIVEKFSESDKSKAELAAAVSANRTDDKADEYKSPEQLRKENMVKDAEESQKIVEKK